MSIYQKFCHEVTDENGMLKEIRLDYPENFNFGYDVVDRIAEEDPDKRALVWCNAEGEEHLFTFSEIRCCSNQMANVFREAGIGQGDRVMLILKRHYEYWFAAIALHKLGAVMIPVTHMLTVSDLVYRLKASRVKAVVCTAQNLVPEKVREALKESGEDFRILVLPDHPTPIRVRTHTSDPVPYLLYDSTAKETHDWKYNEREGLASGNDVGPGPNMIVHLFG